MDQETISKITALFEQTIKNAGFYLANNKKMLFIGEMGVAKGLLYALQAKDIIPNSEYMGWFCGYIAQEKKWLEEEKRKLF